MKVAIVTTTLIGLSMTTAMACDYNKNVQASTPMSTLEKSALVQSEEVDARQAFLLHKNDQRISNANVATE